MSETAISISGDGVRVHLALSGYERLAAEDESDLNWLAAQFEIVVSNFRGAGACSLTANDLQAWHDELERLLLAGRGTVHWETEEEGLRLDIDLLASGRVTLAGSVAEYGSTYAKLSFRAESDRARMEELLAGLKVGVTRFPIRVTPSEA